MNTDNLTLSNNTALAKIYFETEDDTTIFAVVDSSAEDIEYSQYWLDEQLMAYGYTGLNVLKSTNDKIEELLANNKSG